MYNPDWLIIRCQLRTIDKLIVSGGLIEQTSPLRRGEAGGLFPAQIAAHLKQGFDVCVGDGFGVLSASFVAAFVAFVVAGAVDGLLQGVKIIGGGGVLFGVVYICC